MVYTRCMTNIAKVKITDMVATYGSVTVAPGDVTESITRWYPEAPDEIVEAIDALQNALMRGRRTTELEAYLGLSIERI